LGGDVTAQQLDPTGLNGKGRHSRW
jgi:hypothetical protein